MEDVKNERQSNRIDNDIPENEQKTDKSSPDKTNQEAPTRLGSRTGYASSTTGNTRSPRNNTNPGPRRNRSDAFVPTVQQESNNEISGENYGSQDRSRGPNNYSGGNTGNQGPWGTEFVLSGKSEMDIKEPVNT